MITLSRLKGEPFIINCDEIEMVESLPDTVITLLSGKKIVVAENPQEVIDRVIAYKRKIYQGPGI